MVFLLNCFTWLSIQSLTPKKAPHLHNAGWEMDRENQKCHPLMLKSVYDTAFVRLGLAIIDYKICIFGVIPSLNAFLQKFISNV
jgi:hypothetical protein